MEFGVFQGVHKDPSHGIGDREAIDHYFWVAKFADQNGFATFWATEHHFSDYGMGGLPGLQLAHIAALTSRIRLATAVYVAPFHHPLRLTEEIVWLDNLSKGRLWIGFGPGFSAYEYNAFGIPIEENHERLYEAIDIVREGLKGQQFSYEGQFWNIGKVQVMPATVQAGGPPLFVATSSEQSIRKAATMGMHCLFGFRPLDVLRRQVELYREAAHEAGFDSATVEERIRRCGILRRVVLADSREQAIQYANHTAVRHQALAAAVHTTGEASPDLAGITAKETQLAGGVMAGTPAQVIDEVRGMEDIGPGHLLLAFNSRGQSLNHVRDQFQRFAGEVIPAFTPVTA